MSDLSYAAFHRRLRDRRTDRDRGLAVFRRVPSTHAAASRVVREYTRENATPPVADLYAWEQTAGQGRHGRHWTSPAGAGVYASLVRPGLAVPIQSLSLRVAVGLCRAIGRHVDGCRVRWPNDLQVGEGKIGGTLIDVVSHGDDDPVAVISFGVDHAADLDLFAEERATSVRAEGGEVELVDLALELGAAVDAVLDPDAALDVAKSYAELSVHRPGDAMEVRRDDGEIEGVFRGFDENGFLRLEVDGEEQRITTGEI